MAGRKIAVARTIATSRILRGYVDRALQIPGAIALFKQDEASGVVAVEFVHKNNGAYKASGQPLLGQAAIVPGYTTALYNSGTSDFCNIYTAGLSSLFSGPVGSMGTFGAVSGAGVWSDATLRVLMGLQVDVNNFVRLQKTATANQITAQYKANSVTKTASLTITPDQATVTPFHLLATWGDLNNGNAFKLYWNGEQAAPTVTALDVWQSGPLQTTACALGALTNAGASPWSGPLSMSILYNRILTPAEALRLAGAY